MNDDTRKIHTLEDPIERAIPNVMQTRINLRAGLDYPELLAVVMRHSPDVIMIGEIRDPSTAAAAVRAGASGQLVLATMHAKSASEAIETMLHYDTHPKFLAGALIGSGQSAIGPPTVYRMPRVDRTCTNRFRCPSAIAQSSGKQGAPVVQGGRLRTPALATVSSR